MYTSKQRAYYAVIAIKHKQRTEINHDLKWELSILKIVSGGVCTALVGPDLQLILRFLPDL